MPSQRYRWTGAPSEGDEEDDINPFLSDTERDDLGDSDRDSEGEEPPAKKRKLTLLKKTTEFLSSTTETPLTNEARKRIKEKFPHPSCDSVFPPKLDDMVKCVIPAKAARQDRFLSKLQQFSMDALGPVLGVYEQL